jgi:polyphosphate glucokinase
MTLLPPPRRLPAYGRRLDQVHRLVRMKSNLPTAPKAPQTTLSVDIGGTGIKMLLLDAVGRPLTERVRWLTPQPALPAAVLETLVKMLATQPPFDRISIGFPGVVVDGVVKTAPNLDTEAWRGFDLQGQLSLIAGRPVRVMNDADLQGFGVIVGKGVEMVLTLGTGLGAGLYVNGHLVPNLELGHHPFKKGKTYEERVSDAELKRIGKKEWSVRVGEMLAQLEPIFNYQLLHIGGGNAEHLKIDLPPNVRLFDNAVGLTGGIRLWNDT